MPDAGPLKCSGRAYFINDICEDERSDLDWAKAYSEYPRARDLSRSVLEKIAAEHGADRAAALFYERTIREPANAALIDFIDRTEPDLRKRRPDYSDEGVLLAVVPGMFWQDNPEIGASGEELRQLAAELGIRSSIVPVEQTGSVEANGRDICDFLDQQKEARSIIVASVSKGGGDVKTALKMCPSGPGMRKVRAWFNIAGITHGSHLVNEIEETLAYKAEARAYFCWKGYNWDGLVSMRAEQGAPLEFDLRVPDHITVVNIAAVPLSRHVTPRARPYYRQLMQYGPNDGISLLADSSIPGGVTYPAFRNDHYFRAPMSAQRMQAFLVYIMSKRFQPSSNSVKSLSP